RRDRLALLLLLLLGAPRGEALGVTTLLLGSNEGLLGHGRRDLAAPGAAGQHLARRRCRFVRGVGSAGPRGSTDVQVERSHPREGTERDGPIRGARREGLARLAPPLDE